MANENLDNIWWQKTELNKLCTGDPIKFDYCGKTYIGRVGYIGHTYLGISGASLGHPDNMIPLSNIGDVYSTPELDADLGI